MELNKLSPESPVAIKICNARKEYKSNVVFKDLNITVPEGIIYGLLGPSGCGKTTLINCIVGQVELDSGSIEISARKRSDIGYMPQTTSLHESLTVYENISFFGFLVGMSESSIRVKADELVALLEIPCTDRLVMTLSGGQKRRVAVAITLLHDPKIIIMDEPTVGLDPILSQCIWNHLLKLAAAGKSILITTHYIQETSQAHMIGLLREGVLLAEEAPNSLMEQYRSKNLEEIFLKLTQKQEMMKVQRNVCEQNKQVKKSKPKQILKKTYRGDHKVFSLKRFQALMYKNIMQLKGDKRFLSFLMILPIIQVVTFNLAIGAKPKNLQILVVNEESSCADPSHFHSCFSNENSTTFLSCLFLDMLRNRSYNLVNYDDLNSGLKEVTNKNENTRALLHFNKNFTKAFGHRIDDFSNISESEILDSFLEAWIDCSDQYIGTFIKYDMVAVVLPFLKEMLLNCDINPKLAYGLVGVNFQTPIFGSMDTEFTSYAAATVVCLCSMFYPSLGVAVYVQEERTSGIIERMIVSGATITEILSSIGFTIFGVHIIQTIVNFFIMFVVFSNHIYGSLIAYSSFQLLIGLMGIIHGFIVALMTDEVLFLTMAIVGTNMILSLTTGLAWPTEAAHSIIKIMNRYFLPLADSVTAVRGIAIKSYSISHPIILRGYFSTVVWNLIYLLILIGILKMRKNVLLAKAAIR